jgi:hypothetical protein
VVQAAAKIVLEAIFEADFRKCSYGFRPRRSATKALEVIRLTGGRGQYHRSVPGKTPRLRPGSDSRTEVMRAGKKTRLMGREWTVGNAAEFLNLSEEEAAFVELKLASQTTSERGA